MLVEPIPKPLSTAIGCKDRGSALSAKKVLNVPQHASEPFTPPALTTAFSLDLVTKQVLGWVLVFFLCLTSTALGRSVPGVQWGRQIVTSTTDSIFGTLVAHSNEGVYLSVTRKSEDGSGQGSEARYLLKYGQDGNPLWSKQLGATGDGNPVPLMVNGLATDDQGNVYIGGHAEGKLGQKTLGKNDAFFAKYDQAGTRQWVRQVGTPEHDVCEGLDIDASGNVYIAGYTYGSFAGPNQGASDILIAAYDKHGVLLWKDQFGTDAMERAKDIRLGKDKDVYLCGSTAGSLARKNNGKEDFVVARYERTGKRLWLCQDGSPAMDKGNCMEIGEQGQIYVGGLTTGDLAFRKAQRGNGDAFIVRIAETGELLWRRQFGSRGYETVFQIARFADGTGDILAGGCQYPTGRCQAYYRRYTPEGKLVWVKVFRKNKGRTGGTCGRAVAIDSNNNCYLAGGTNADNFAVNNGTSNVFLIRLD